MDSAILRKYHGSRTWRLDPFSGIKNIELQQVDGENDHFQYMVFNLPYVHLRAGACSFCDFKQTGKAQSFKDSFLLFLQLLNKVATSGTDSVNSKCCCFLETVQLEGVSIGVRIWFFSNRVKTTLHGNLIGLIMGNSTKYKTMQSKTPKMAVKLAAHEGNLRCKSLHNYVQLISNYTNCESNMALSEDIHLHIKLADCALGPASIFSVESNGFTYKANAFADFAQNKPENYVDGNKFKFPNEKMVLRVSPEQITIDKLFLEKKYLPSYFFEKVRLPSVDVLTFDHNGESWHRVKVPDHIHRKKKVDGVAIYDRLVHLQNGGNQEGDELVYKTTTYKTTIEPLIRKVFVVSFLNENNDTMYYDDGVRKFLKYTQKYKAKQELSDQWFTDILHDMRKDPDTKSLLADKNSLDTLDMLKYTSELLIDYYRDKRVEFQRKMMADFERSIVRDANSNISTPLQTMIHWYHSAYDPKLQIARKKTDPNGSVFLNSIAWKLNFFDEDLQVSTGHPTLMLLNHSKYDSYRQELNLHINLIFTGEGATSKSFLFEKMKQMSIAATITELTYQTKRAGAVEKDQNDVITVFNEAPAGLFMSDNGKNGDLEQEASFKEKLTSQTTKCLTYWKDEENDKRDNKEVISQAIGTYFGATNDDPSTASEAMTTRFYWGEFEKCERKNKTIDMCMRGEKEWKDVGGETLKKGLHYFHLEHLQMALLFKLMFAGIVRYPSLDVADFIYSQMSKSLRQQKVETTTRFKERFDILCRIFTMTNALDTVYNYEGGKHYGKPFDCTTLVDVEPLLNCTEEIAIFCFTMLSNEIFNPSETKILKSVWKIWKLAGGDQYEKKVGEHSTLETSYDFIKINKTGKKLRSMIQQNIPNSEGRPSDFNIKAVLAKIKNKSYKNYNMVHVSTLPGEQRQYNDGKPERAGHLESQSDGMREDSDAYFNIQLFHNIRLEVDNDPISKAVNNCRHHHTIPKKIICGCPERKNAVIQYPSVFKVIHLAPMVGRVLKRRNPLYKGQASRNIRQIGGTNQLQAEEQYVGSKLSQDFDKWGCLQHAKRLNVAPGALGTFFEQYYHVLVEEKIACHNGSAVVNYPDDVINGYTQTAGPSEETYIDPYADFDFEGIITAERAKRMRVD